MKGVGLIGHTVCDSLTGFKGVVTGHCTYITGCAQVLVQPRGKDDTVRPEPQWFDEQRVQDCPDAEVVMLDNGATPGCDAPAPKR